MMTTPEIKWGQCCYCRRWYRNLTNASCAQCEDEIAAFAQQYDKGAKYTPRYIIQSDPDPDGGFRPGAGFNRADRNATLALGNFTPGTIIRDSSTGKCYRVVGTDHQKMVAV